MCCAVMGCAVCAVLCRAVLRCDANPSAISASGVLDSAVLFGQACCHILQHSGNEMIFLNRATHVLRLHLLKSQHVPFQRLYAAGLGSTTSNTAAQDQAAASQAPASTAAAIKAEPTGPAAFVKQEVATATQPSVKHDTIDPIAQASQAQPDSGFNQTQSYGAARQTGSTQMQGDEATQPYEAVPQFDPWNALEIMWDSDTPPGWPKLICPWQVTPLPCLKIPKAQCTATAAACYSNLQPLVHILTVLRFNISAVNIPRVIRFGTSPVSM